MIYLLNGCMSIIVLTLQRYINFFYKNQIVKSKPRFVYRLSIIEIFKIMIINIIKMSLTITCLSLLDPINVIIFARSCQWVVAFHVAEDAVAYSDVFRVVDAEVAEEGFSFFSLEHLFRAVDPA